MLRSSQISFPEKHLHSTENLEMQNHEENQKNETHFPKVSKIIGGTTKLQNENQEIRGQ
jgi:hypothetical protein